MVLYELRYDYYKKDAVMYSQNDVSLVTVAWNNKKVLELMLKSYVKHHYRGEPLKLGLIDNNSDDGTKDWLIWMNIPFLDFTVNVGHENAVNILYKELRTPCMLLSDTDVEYIENVYDKYLPLIDDRCKLIGDFITGDVLGSPVKPRVGAWFMLTDVQAMKEKGVNTFRTKEDWSYDVGSEYTENVLENDFSIRHTERYNGNIDRDVIGMNYGSHWHYGKLSWNLQNHRDRESEVAMRMKFITEERLPLYEDIDLRGKFKWL
jgi:glycosyltransferase involved in cell wall biosynthesis